MELVAGLRSTCLHVLKYEVNIFVITVPVNTGAGSDNDAVINLMSNYLQLKNHISS